eukprot:3141805-Prymnesium_polylepis.1
MHGSTLGGSSCSVTSEKRAKVSRDGSAAAVEVSRDASTMPIGAGGSSSAASWSGTVETA